ncbi:hypothetical protein, partial [Streptomyces evansiae]|uniref:hypothetical protein n=1 Tax=Streptomyces evansiae TaxID=3075535 RepID=UPI002887652C
RAPEADAKPKTVPPKRSEAEDRASETNRTLPKPNHPGNTTQDEEANYESEAKRESGIPTFAGIEFPLRFNGFPIS